MDRKKELKEQYKNMKPDMGVLMVKNEKNNKCYVEGTQNLKPSSTGSGSALSSEASLSGTSRRSGRHTGSKASLSRSSSSLSMTRMRPGPTTATTWPSWS